MKRKLLRFFLLLLIVIIVLVIWQPWIIKVITGEGMILSKTEMYYTINEKGKEIKAKFYLKQKNLQGDKVKEIIVRFKEGSERDYYLILIPDRKWVGRPNQSKKDYTLILNKWLYQSESGGKFKIINTPDGAGVHQLIEQSNFNNDTIRFNTFDEFEKMGKEIVIVKK
jgi:hypothetical protein